MHGGRDGFFSGVPYHTLEREFASQLFNLCGTDHSFHVPGKSSEIVALGTSRVSACPTAASTLLVWWLCKKFWPVRALFDKSMELTYLMYFGMLSPNLPDTQLYLWRVSQKHVKSKMAAENNWIFEISILIIQIWQSWCLILGFRAQETQWTYF